MRRFGRWLLRREPVAAPGDVIRLETGALFAVKDFGGKTDGVGVGLGYGGTTYERPDTAEGDRIPAPFEMSHMHPHWMLRKELASGQARLVARFADFPTARAATERWRATGSLELRV